ncbi:MAG: SCO family protein [Alphaproteobacteria bacterium]|nr:SCO family protein [Alphaproteobacteria bacterium]
MQRKQRNLFILGAISFAVGLFAILGVIQTKAYLKTAAISQDIKGLQTGLPTIGGGFQLVDKDGKVWKDTDFRGKPMLVYFGYSYCPDICPTALSHLTQAVEKLGDGKVQPIFITLDPERDTPENLQNFAQNFHKDFLMLTGSESQVDHVKKGYKIYAAHVSEDKDAEIDHSSLIYLMDKEGNYRAHFNHQTPSEDILKRVKLHIETGE